MRRRFFRALQAAWLAALAGAVLGAPSARLTHLSEGHAICPLHGELIEVHAEPHHGGATTSGMSLSGLENGVAGWSHDICPFADAGVRGQPPRALQLQNRAPATLEVGLRAVEAPPPAPVALLLLAPKSSPPVLS